MHDHCEVTSDAVVLDPFLRGSRLQSKPSAKFHRWPHALSAVKISAHQRSRKFLKPAACRLFDQYVKSAIESSVANQVTILVPLQASQLPLHAFVRTNSPAIGC